MKYNRFRVLADISLKKENRSGPPRLTFDNPEVKHRLQLDNHANNYRDGNWGSIRHFVVKEG